MLELTDHKAPGLNDALRIYVRDYPLERERAGRADCQFTIEWDRDPTLPGTQERLFLNFQEGPPKECGVNGISNEAALAILIHRFRQYQQGPHACAENKWTLLFLESALRVIKRRTQERATRGVEGTPQA